MSAALYPDDPAGDAYDAAVERAHEWAAEDRERHAVDNGECPDCGGELAPNGWCPACDATWD